ncbi:MAG: hypothetical protein U5L96_19120 [Owenweeksia sp.]|nr:hypothetical protein [Owenweeksia sp.]
MHSNDHERIWLGSSAFDELNRLLGEDDYSRIIFLVDENTHTHCLPLLPA